MHVVVAPDKFKGSLTAAEVAARVAAGHRRGRARRRRSCGSRSPTAATAPSTPRWRRATSGSRCGPAARPASRSTPRSRCATGVAVVEMADVSGLRLLPPDRLAPLTRQLVRHRRGRRAPRSTGAAARVVLGIGGSASTDGGAGMLQALGARLLDAAGRPSCPAAAAALAALDRVDLSGLHPAVRADPDRRRQRRRQPAARPARRRRGLRAAEGREPGRRRGARRRAGALGGRWSTRRPGRDGRPRPAGRRGRRRRRLRGHGRARRASCEPGIELVLDLVGFADHLPGAQLVITGEGSLDEQTLHGKAPAGVAAAAAKAGVPVVTVSGRLALTHEQLRAAGIRRPTRSPTSNPTCSAARPRPARCCETAGRSGAGPRAG